MKIKLVIILIFLSFFRLEGQNQGNLWFLGDSLGLDFGYQPPMRIISPVSSTKVCLATLCDTLGNLQYYEQSISTHIDTGISVYDKLHNRIPMLGGTKGNFRSINSFLPFTNTDITGYLVGFVNSNSTPTQNHFAMQELYFSKLNNSYRNGLGDWIENYNQPISTFDSIRGGGGTGHAVTRHANGRDWWIVGKRHRDDTLIVWYVSPDTIVNIGRQKIGSYNCVSSTSPTAGANGGTLVFSQNGDRLLNVNGEGLVEVFNYDRCSGLLFSPLTIEVSDASNQSIPSSRGMYSACFSPTGRFIYACQYDFVNPHFNLVQYDINSVNPSLNKVILFNQPMPFANADRGFLTAQLGPDGKIYLVPRNVGGGYPVDSTCLSTIDFPEVPGTGCGFVLNSICYNKLIHSSHFSLAPNYDLGPIDGSLCDTLGIDVRVDTPNIRLNITEKIKLHLYPNPAYQSIKLEGLDGLQIITYRLYNLQGRFLLSSSEVTNDKMGLIDVSNLQSGTYLLEVDTDEGLYREKVVILNGY